MFGIFMVFEFHKIVLVLEKLGKITLIKNVKMLYIILNLLLISNFFHKLKTIIQNNIYKLVIDLNRLFFSIR